MATTNFALLTDEQKTVWSLDFWRQARNQSFITRFLGRSQNSMIQRITELTRTHKGARAVLTLLADLEGDGIAGDRMLEGNEEPGKSYDVVIQLDQLRHAMRHEGKMADQKSVVNFRSTARDRLAYWIADRLDQLAFLTLAGIPYTFNTNGTTRVGSDLKNLEFAKDVLPPSAKRVAQWDDASGLIIGGATSAITPADTPAWKMFIEAKAYAKENYIRGVMVNGEETYHAFLSPMAMSRLKVDPDYLSNLRHAQSRGDKNELFTGTSVKIDGIYLHEFRHVPNTRLAPVGSKWGSSGDVDGCQILFCGAQALAMADIGAADWVEKDFDFDNSPGIAVGKIMGFLKPQFVTQYSGGSKEDHGLLSIYVAQ